MKLNVEQNNLEKKNQYKQFTTPNLSDKNRLNSLLFTFGFLKDVNDFDDPFPFCHLTYFIFLSYKMQKPFPSNGASKCNFFDLLSLCWLEKRPFPKINGIMTTQKIQFQIKCFLVLYDFSLFQLHNPIKRVSDQIQNLPKCSDYLTNLQKHPHPYSAINRFEPLHKLQRNLMFLVSIPFLLIRHR